MASEFSYFGYGSNMSPMALAAKGVTPLSARRAILNNWRLVFDVPDFFPIEGGTGNIQRAPGREVHGVLYTFLNADRKRLDELEALGVSYDRIEQQVCTYDGKVVTASVYVGIHTRLQIGLYPSRRYLDILLRGAREISLDADYVERLSRIEVCSTPAYGEFDRSDCQREFDVKSLAEQPLCTAIAGVVFDMTEARAEHEYLQKLLGRTDVTVFFLRRMSTSSGTEELEDFIAHRLDIAQIQYLNNYLHEFAREYRCVGFMNYSDIGDSSRIGRVQLHAEDGIIAVRRVLEEATLTNLALGHENAGFLSESHGFMPKVAPLSSLPLGFEAWDLLANNLAAHYADLTLRSRLDALPILSADSGALADSYLLRAASVLAMLSHAYFYVETNVPKAMPDALVKPWEQVRERLGREQAVLSYIDLIVYNWAFKDPTRADPMRVENLRLMTPTVNTQSEQVFYLTQTEILAQCSPVIGAVVRAQEAVHRDAPQVLATELGVIMECLKRVLRESLFKIDPNPSGPTFVDPVVWAKTVAPFAVPMKPGLLGPSGTSSPIFNLLDSFLGRDKAKTFLGKEIRALRQTYPRFWRQFLEAVEETSIRDYIEASENAELKGLLREVSDVYAGDNGFLGRHRMKVYGYLELAFKVGRSVTIGGFSGMFQERAWDQVDSELEYARIERVQSFPRGSHVGVIRKVFAPQAAATDGVRSVLIDVSSSGLRCEAGDRCAILAENDEELVERTLLALHADGSERIPLSQEWQSAVSHRPGYSDFKELSLRELLSFGKIRPVIPRVGEALHAASQNEELLEAIERQTLVRWELWDLLDVLEKGGYDTRKLLAANAASPEHFCRIVPPESFRMYSISSVTQDEDGLALEVSLTVGRIRYTAGVGQGTAIERRGTASNFLTNQDKLNRSLSFYFEHPPRFSLPADPNVPIVMVAGGTGIGPFRGFIAERRRQTSSACDWLLWAARSRNYFYYADDLAPSVAENRLEVGVAFSRDDASVRFVADQEGGGYFDFIPGNRCHIRELLLNEENAKKIWDLIRSPEDGGQGAHFYVCGRAGFSRAVYDAMLEILARTVPGHSEQSARMMMRQLVGEGRYLQELFTDAPSGENPRQEFFVSDLIEHNSNDVGYWILIDGLVYDIGEFLHLHPGGLKALRGYTGMDGTQGFLRTHVRQSEVHAMLTMFEIGRVFCPDFQRVSVEVEREGAKQRFALAALYRAWNDTAFLVVEMQNALRSDQGIQDTVIAEGDPRQPRSLYKLQFSIETHQRFILSYLDGLTETSSTELWKLTQRMCAANRDPNWMADVLSAVEASDAARFVDGVLLSLSESVARCIAGCANVEERDRLMAACCLFEEADRDFLAKVKAMLRRGIILFETGQAETLDNYRAELVSCLSELPSIVESYYRECADALQRDDWQVSRYTERRPQRMDGRGILSQLLVTSYYTMEENPQEGLVILTRNARAIDSLDALISQNEEVISHMRPEHISFGIVVDMRQAPARNDPDFELAMAKLRAEIYRRYSRVAVLLMSAPGVLQVNRIGRNEGAESFATLSMSAASCFARRSSDGSE